MANEIVTNCLKHGFADGRRGRIHVSVQRIPGAVRMIVKDNGVGLPVDFDLAKCNSMGLKLAASLAHQLGGDLKFTSDDGCQVQADLTRLGLQVEKREKLVSGAGSTAPIWAIAPVTGPVVGSNSTAVQAF
jgi:two-component sensor histidine kinase